MPVDLVPGAPSHLRQDRRHPQIFEIDRALTARANEMVVVRPRIASHVGVIAVWEVEPLHDPEPGQDFERPEDRRPRSLDLAPPGIRDQVGRLEGSVAGADQIYDGAPGVGHPVAGVIERLDEIVRRRACMTWRRDAHGRQHSPAIAPPLRLSLDSVADRGRSYQPQISSSVISIGTEDCLETAPPSPPGSAASSIQSRYRAR